MAPNEKKQLENARKLVSYNCQAMIAAIENLRKMAQEKKCNDYAADIASEIRRFQR